MQIKLSLFDSKWFLIIALKKSLLVILEISGLFRDKLFQHLGTAKKGNRRKDSLSTLGIKYSSKFIKLYRFTVNTEFFTKKNPKDTQLSFLSINVSAEWLNHERAISEYELNNISVWALNLDLEIILTLFICKRNNEFKDFSEADE